LVKTSASRRRWRVLNIVQDLKLRGFDRAVRLAEDRLKEIEGWHGG